MRWLIVLPFLLGACSFSPSADVIKALAGDQNSLCFTEASVWVNFSLDRNHGCPNNAKTGTAVVTPVLNPNGTVNRFEVQQ